MGAIGYLYRKTLMNRIKMALRKPVTYIYLVIVVFYFTAVPMSLKVFVDDMGAGNPEGMATVLTVLAFWVIPANMIAYAKRKGLVYKNCDVHFLFPSPVSPKKVLLYAHFRTLVPQTALGLFAVVCGGVMFHVELWRLALYFFFSMIVENLLEGSIMTILYGSERLGERQRALVVRGAYALVGILVVMGIYTYLQEGMSMEAVSRFLHSDMIQMVPLMGWYVGLIHLLFLGPTTLNVAVSICYLLATVLLFLAARGMKCEGGFYEDAVKFAEDYEEVLKNHKMGNNEKRLGKKQKYKSAHVTWKGHGARALFYRQLLEYKKRKFFIFDMSTVAALAGGAGIVFVYTREGGFGSLDKFGPFVIPAVASYLIFVFTALNGKWAKELASPYTYMIPDTVFRKLVNATAMEHVRNFVNGCIITIPGAFVMHMSLPVTALCILFYMLLAANKLYALAVAEAAVGNILGATGRQLLQMLIQGMAIFAAVVGGLLGMVIGGVMLAYVIMDVFLALFTLIFMVIAVLNFYNMEKA